MFGRTASPTLDLDDPHLEVTVTPSQSAFYAGELFSAVITLRNTRTPVRTAHSQPVSPNPQHLHLLPGAGSSSPGSPSPHTPGGTPGTPRGYNDWRGHARKPSGGRRSQSLGLGKGISPQEIVWALGGEAQSTPEKGPPPLPARRGSGIPSAHPHARKISIASTVFNSPPAPNRELPDPTSPIPDELDEEGSRPSSRATPRPSPTLPDVSEEATDGDGDGDGARGSASPSVWQGQAPSPISPSRLDLTTSPTSPLGSVGSLDSPLESPRHSPARLGHRRAPSYHNSYGASLLTPPPSHPMRRPAIQTGVTSVLWGHARLVSRFAPSHAYIPPDPLLPLRARLLHQPIGSGSLAVQQTDRPSSRWSLSFGTGTIGESTQPSLTGSLFGLAKGLVMGGTGGSLEEERKRVWTTHDLPVLETSRSLMGVDIKLGEGETREFVYTIQLPATLPPAFKGKALRFSYEMILSLNVALPGGGKRQRSKEFVVPVRVWPNVSLHHHLRTYDVLRPIIQTAETGSLVERSLTPPAATPAATPRRPGHMAEPLQSIDSLAGYARRLVRSVEAHKAPPSPSKSLRPLSPKSPQTPRGPLSPNALSPRPFLLDPSSRPRSMSGVTLPGDDELVDADDGQRCGEAVEILSRHSPKASYDIRQDGEVVAVLTLVKTTYRLGETVTGVVTFNDHPDRRVLKLSAYLETHEVIPEPLLPPSASSAGRVRQPELRRLHAEQRTGYAQFTSRTAFSLDIPSDATPAFTLAAGEGGKGGLQWRVRLAFLVAVPPKRCRVDATTREASGDGRGGERTRRSTSPDKRRGKSPDKSRQNKKHRGEAQCLHLVPVDGDADNAPYTAAPGLVPYVTTREGWAETRAETVECEVPVQVLAGNTAFVIRPSVFTV